jgi:hypothetical protein
LYRYIEGTFGGDGNLAGAKAAAEAALRELGGALVQVESSCDP